MDKLEEIKKEWRRIKSGDTLEGINVEWLISEIERLEKVEKKAIKQSEYIQNKGLSEYEKVGLEGKITLQNKEIEQLKKENELMWWTLDDMACGDYGEDTMKYAKQAMRKVEAVKEK